METYIVTVDGTAYEVTVQKKSQLQPLHQRPQLRAARLPECAQHHPFPFR